MAAKFPPPDGNFNEMEMTVGEKVTMEGREGDFIVVDIDHSNGRVELLRVKPGKIESGIPLSSVRRASSSGLTLVLQSKE